MPRARFRIDPSVRARLGSLLTAALLLVVYGMLAWLSVRHSFEADWTAAGRHSLSEASLEVLARMQEPLEITAYAREEPELRDLIERFVDRYRRVKPGITLHFVNPDAVPDEVRNLGVGVNGELVLRYGGRVEHVRNDSESEFTNALQRLLRTGERWVAFLEGHGERSPLGQTPPDLGDFARQLKQRGFRLQPLNLGETRAIPDNTSVLVIAGARMPLLPGESELVLQFLERGGNLLWLLDPGDMPEPALAERLGIEYPPGVIIDFAGQLLGLNDPTVALVTASLYGDHPATRGFSLTSLFPNAGMLRAREDSGWSTTTLLGTGEHTWLETGKLEGEVALDEGVDVRGPLAIGLSLTRVIDDAGKDNTRSLEQRAIVIGDGDFLSNTYAANTGNLELGLRIMNWLTRDEDLIDIPARTLGDSQLDMNGTLLGAFGIFFLLVLPLALILAGAGTWWRRNRQ